jgi:hypothetical protein
MTQIESLDVKFTLLIACMQGFLIEKGLATPEEMLALTDQAAGLYRNAGGEVADPDE